VLDMAGNVWEWCSTKWRESYKEEADDGLEGDGSRVLRGGSFLNLQGTRAAPLATTTIPTLVTGTAGFGLWWCLLAPLIL